MQAKFWKNPENGRNYIAAPIKDLLNDYIIAVANGGEQMRHRRYKTIYASKVKDEIKEQNALEEINEIRERRGYVRAMPET